MNIRLIAAIPLVALVLSCGPAMTAEQKREALLSERTQVYADLHRQKAECQAQAIEFSGDRRIAENCMATFEAMVDASRKTIALIDKRIEEIESTKLIPFNGKLDGAK